MRLPFPRETGRAHAAVVCDVAQADAGAVHGIGGGNGGTHRAVALGVLALHLAVDGLGGAGGQAKAGQAGNRRLQHDGFSRSGWGLARLVRDRPRADHMLRNSVMKGWLTMRVSGRCLRRTVPLPLSSRTMEAIAFRLTMVERWICLNTAGSSCSSSSRIGLRSSASPSAVIATVYLWSARK